MTLAGALGRTKFRPATLRDLAMLLRLQADFYREEAYPHHPRRAREAWRRLLSGPRHGRVWVAESGRVLEAYLVVTLGFSLERLGVIALVDEVYVVPDRRGQGLGRAALKTVETACRKAGARALHLEVERNNAGARALYRQLGFEESTRVLMTKRLGSLKP